MLKHVTQPTKDSCQSACIAMFTGQDVKLVMEEWHEKLKGHNSTMAQALKSYGLEHFFYGDERLTRLFGNTCYILGVPSLNNVGGQHAIVVMVTPEVEVIVLDPAKGRGNGIKHYVYGPEDMALKPDEARLVAWDVVIAVPVHNDAFWNR